MVSFVRRHLLSRQLGRQYLLIGTSQLTDNRWQSTVAYGRSVDCKRSVVSRSLVVSERSLVSSW